MRTIDFPNPPEVAPEPAPRGPFDGELLDLYVAIAIVVPFALLLKSLWA